MIGIVGAVLTGVTCALLGFKMSASLKKRVTSLNSIINSLEILESEINFGMNKLKQAFLRLDNHIFDVVAKNMECMGIREAVLAAVCECENELCFKKEDSDALVMLGENIGRTDVENQIKNIMYIKSILSDNQRKAKDEYERFGTLYRNGGILVGLMIVTILI